MLGTVGGVFTEMCSGIDGCRSATDPFGDAVTEEPVDVGGQFN